MHGLKGEISRFHTSHDSSLWGRENNRTWEKPHDFNKYLIPASTHSKNTYLFSENSHMSQYMVNSTTQQYQQHSCNNDWRAMSGHPIAYNHHMSCCNGTKNQRAQEIIYENTLKQSNNYSPPTKHAYPENDTRHYYKHKNQTGSLSDSPRIRVRDVHTLNNYFNDYSLGNNLRREDNYGSFLRTNHAIRSKGFTQQRSQIPCVEGPIQKNFQNHQIFKTMKPSNIYQTHFLSSYENCREANNQRRNSHPQYFTNLSDANSRSANNYSARKANDISSNNFNCPTNYDFQCNSNMLSSVTSCDNNNSININGCEKNSNKLFSQLQTFRDNVCNNQKSKQFIQGFPSIRIEEENFEISYPSNPNTTTRTSHLKRDDPKYLPRNNSKQVNSVFNVPTSVKVSVEKIVNDSEVPRVQNTNNCKNLKKETPQSCSFLYSSLVNPYPNTTFEFDDSRLCKKTHISSELKLNEQSKHFIPEGTTRQENTKVKNEAAERLPKKICSDHLSSNRETGNYEGEKSAKLNDSVEKSKSSGLKETVQKHNKKLIVECEKISKNDVHTTINVVVEVLKKELDSNQSECLLTTTSQSPSSSETPDIQNFVSEKSENSTSNQDSKLVEEKIMKCESVENTVVTNSPSEKFKANIDRKKLDKLKQFLKNSSSFENSWCEDLKKEESSETRLNKKRKHEDDFLFQRRRKLSKCCIVKNKNNQREMISLKNFKTPINENKNNINNGFEKSPTSKTKAPVENKTQDAPKLIKVPKSDLNLDTKIRSKEVDLTEHKLKSLNKEIKKEKTSIYEVSNHVPCSSDKSSCTLKRKDSVKENFHKKKKKKSKLKFKPSESSYPMLDDYKIIVDVMKAFKKIEKNFCYYCNSLRSADLFWLNLVTAELKCLHCCKKVSTPRDSGRNEM